MTNEKNTKPSYWNPAIKHFSNVDPVLCDVISKYKSKNYLTVTNTPFKTLFSIIVGQQISIEAAKSIE
ncbi:MAG: DNA-3-methyladenine glycosylase, partial [Flavobacteriaceae bacterium]|nr:DNA-3-methyladenine glycosylase [Flavobacteriaceae bacterium]